MTKAWLVIPVLAFTVLGSMAHAEFARVKETQGYIFEVKQTLENKRLACTSQHGSEIWLDEFAAADDVEKNEQLKLPALIFRRHIDPTLIGDAYKAPSNIASEILVRLTADGVAIVGFDVKRPKADNSALEIIDTCR